MHEPGQPAQTILKTQEQLSPAGFEATDWQRMSVTFGPGAWLGSTDDPGLRLPAAGLSVEVRQDVHRSEVIIEESDVVTHVLKNILTDTVVAFGADGKPRQSDAGLAALDLRLPTGSDPRGPYRDFSKNY